MVGHGSNERIMMTNRQGSERSPSAQLAHDLRQPLAAMKTWAELLDASLEGGAVEKQRRYVGKLHSEISRMVSMLDEFSAKEAASGTD